MSTRCNILLTQDLDEYNCTHADTPATPVEIWLYHHSDGGPEGVGRQLVDLMEWIAVHKHQYVDIESIGNALLKQAVKPHIYRGADARIAPVDDGFELTVGRHGDIEYLYKIVEHWNAEGTAIDEVTLDCEDLYTSQCTPLAKILRNDTNLLTPHYKVLLSL